MLAEIHETEKDYLFIKIICLKLKSLKNECLLLKDLRTLFKFFET